MSRTCHTLLMILGCFYNTFGFDQFILHEPRQGTPQQLLSHSPLLTRIIALTAAEPFKSAFQLHLTSAAGLEQLGYQLTPIADVLKMSITAR